MTNGLALVVDDSRTARITLKRMLEKHALHVDTVESAQHALDYLVSKTPDVIFMDHMMPGMDGLQAVQAIKSNPATATIPIMMYTSKEGDLYVSQARALGAIGILPKQVEPAQLFEVLNNRGLGRVRRTRRPSTYAWSNTRARRADPDTGRDANTRRPGPQGAQRAFRPPICGADVARRRDGDGVDVVEHPKLLVANGWKLIEGRYRTLFAWISA